MHLLYNYINGFASDFLHFFEIFFKKTKMPKIEISKTQNYAFSNALSVFIAITATRSPLAVHMIGSDIHTPK